MDSIKLKLLVIDDSISSRKWLIEAIPKVIMDNAEIFEAEDGEVGVQLFKEKKPDMVFLDITMPKMDGFEALKQILEHDKDAKVVMVTADRQKRTKERILQMGALEIVNKPIDADQLREVLLSVSFGQAALT